LPEVEVPPGIFRDIVEIVIKGFNAWECPVPIMADYLVFACQEMPE
jgi:hypothetical protein